MSVEIILLLLLSVGSLFYLRWYLLPVPVQAEVGDQRFGYLDAVLIGGLMLLLLANAWESMGQTQVITIRVIVLSSVIYLSLVLLLIGVLVARRFNLIKLFGLNWTTWKRNLPLAILALLSLYPILLLVQMGILQWFGPQTAMQDVLHFLKDAKNWDERGSVIVMAIICAPLAEEVIFRGYLFGVIRQYLGVWPGLIISSAIFAFIHAHIPSAPGLFLLALVLSAVYQKTGSLWAPILLHSLFNAITVVFTLVWPQTSALQ